VLFGSGFKPSEITLNGFIALVELANINGDFIILYYINQLFLLNELNKNIYKS